MLYVLLYVVFTIVIAYGSRVVHRNRHRSRTWWALERIRSAMAYEGDPGPYKPKAGAA